MIRFAHHVATLLMLQLIFITSVVHERSEWCEALHQNMIQMKYKSSVVLQQIGLVLNRSTHCDPSKQCLLDQ
jgi:hypothetical protein